MFITKLDQNYIFLITTHFLQLICQIATAKIGVVLVTMNPSYKLYELEKVMNIVDVAGIVIQPQLRHANYAEMINEFLPELKSGINCDSTSIYSI